MTGTATKTYKWANSAEWLEDKIANAGEDTLRNIALELMRQTDFDGVQEAFQDWMEEDGYFKEVNVP